MKRTSGGDMEKGTYDTNGNSVVDKAEAVRVLDDFPGSPASGEILVKTGKVYVRISE